MNKLKALFTKYYDIIAYLFFGVVTTIVNYLVYFPCHNWLHLSGTVSNIIAWVAAVAFAFVTNKPFVFKSHDWSMKTLKPELANFLGCRIGSGIMEVLIIKLTVEILLWDGNMMKIVVSVLVVVLNYIGSKLLVFRKN